MKLKKLWIDDFKNLQDFTAEFNTSALTTVLVGRSGTGKSNVLEALILIFRNLDLGDTPALRYRLTYDCKGAEVQIDADPKRSGDVIRISVQGEDMSFSKFSGRGEGEYLPSFVFAYYSGASDRMAEHFAKHEEEFTRELLDGRNEPLRRLLYARLVHSQFVLLSFFRSDNEDRELLRKYLWIEDLESVLFVLKRPQWYNRNRKGTRENPGDPRFWYARGVVRDFLGKLYGRSLAPLTTGSRGSGASSFERLYLFLKDKAALADLASEYQNSREFFTALESLDISDLVASVRTRVKIRGARNALTFRELSEGEQQLLTVLGLLRFIQDEEALFLLDEPDTHLNPAWSLNYVELLKETIRASNTSQILMATHDPLVVAGMTREEVLLMKREEGGYVSAQYPEEDPRGMGVAGLLMSDIYGLRSDLDLYTLRLLDQKRALAARIDLQPEEQHRLDELNDELEDLDATRSVRDPLFKLFADEMARLEREEELDDPVLSEGQRQRRRQLASEIVERLQRGEQDVAD